jgi:hypothetical protein
MRSQTETLTRRAGKPLCLAMVGLFGLGLVHGQEAKKPAKGQADTAVASAPAVEAATSPLTAFGRQVPAMRPNRGVWIPSFVNGVRNSLVEAEVMTRIDDQRMQAENLSIHLYGKEAKENVEIILPSATYHMTHQILRSDERSKVSRMDFDLEGDSMVFDTVTSQGRMTGNVRMTIHDARGFMASMNESKKEEPEAPEGSNGAAAVPTDTAISTTSKVQPKPATPKKP